MTFLSPSFIFVFLPIALGIYAMAPKLRRIDLLPMLSAVFFVCVNIHDLLSLVYYFSITIFAALTLKLYKRTKKRRCLYVLEYSAFGAALIALLYRFVFGGDAIHHAGLLMCLIAVISMCSDIAKNEGRAPDTVWEAMIYVTFFPVMLAGPFVRYGDFIEKLDKVSFSTDNVLKGMLRFLIGFVKCIAISSLLGKAYNEIILLEGEFGLFVCMVVASICAVRIYTLFSGYSDMARGIALMLGVDIKKDFRDPFANVTPADYGKRFFRSLSEFVKIYVVEPIDTLFGGRVIGVLLGGVLAGCYYVFILCPTPSLAAVLFLPAALLAYFVVIRPRDKRIPICKALKPVFAVLTFILMSVVWFSISLGNIDDIVNMAASVAKNPVLYASYDVKGILFSKEFIIIPVIAAALIFVISRILGVEKVEGEKDIDVKTLIARAVSMTLLAAMFIFSVVVLLPQFPDVATYVSFFRFV